MPCLVTFGFLLYAACKRFGDIDSGLVCDAEKNHMRREYGDTYWWYYRYQ